MPPKSKQSSSEWNQCTQCSIVVHFRDLSRHRDECGKTITHGHVIEGRLHGIVATRSTDAGEKLSVPAHQREQLVLLHPSVMQLCGLTIGGCCVVQQKLVKVAWPNSSLGTTAVGISENCAVELGVTKGELITVETLHETQRTADEVTLMSRYRHPVFKEESFVTFIHERLAGRYLHKMGDVSIAYYGQKYDFSVQTISETRLTPQSFVIGSVADSNTSGGLSESLANLSISENSFHNTSIASVDHELSESDSERSQIGTSTPNRHSHTDSINTDTSKGTDKSEDSNSEKDKSVFFDIDDGVNKTPAKGIDDSINKTPARSKGRAIIDRESFCTPKACRASDKDTETFYKVVSSTRIVIECEGADEEKGSGGVGVQAERTLYSDIGGQEKQIEALKEMIHLPLESPELYRSYGLPQPRGVLIFGPSGCGKSMLVRAIQSEMPSINVVNISGPELWSKFYGETETKLKNLFQLAIAKSPCLIVLEEVEAICPRRDATQSDLEKRVVSSLLTLMDGIGQVSKEKFVLVVGTTSKPDQIDPAIRRPGRFDREIEIGVPSAKDRRQILQKQLAKLQHNLTDVEAVSVADAAHGYVGADLVALCKEASLHAMKQHTRQGGSLQITLGDLTYALGVVQPSAMREVQLEVPKVMWTDIGGQAEVKLKLRQAVEWPLRHPEAFTRMGISPPKGILMYGPPGCSKTMIAKALATESGLNFIAVKGPELFSKWVGESERAVREVFRKARAAAPAIIFFDEIDALAIERGSSSGGSNVADRVLAQLLTEMDGVEKLRDVTIVAATNRPDMIDKALLRPGRIDRVLYVPLPDLKTRGEIFEILLRKMPYQDDVTGDWLAERTEGYSGAEISSVCHEAALFALQEDINSTVVTLSHFEQALKVVTPRISASLIQFYHDYHTNSGLHSI